LVNRGYCLPESLSIQRIHIKGVVGGLTTVYNSTGRTVTTKKNTVNRRPHLNHHLLNKGFFSLFVLNHPMK